ncbi:plcA [Symbiodinium sp. CCMP2456]|nr:plcA [Symbiodinium sp. CCMP2456]
MAQRAAPAAELSGRVVGLPSLVGQAIALQGPDASQKRASVRAGAAVSLTPSLAKIANKDVVVELRGLPQAPPFKVGGRSGNAVTSSQSSKIHRGWRIVAVCGQRVPAEEVPAALSAAQKSAKYSVTFRLSTEEEFSKEKDQKEEDQEERERDLDIEREQARLREEESRKERERMEEERLERELQEQKRLAEAEAKALQVARQAAEKSLEKSTGLPARDKVQEPQKALLAALAPAAPAEAKPVAKPNGPCDKCDGPHATDDCPHFKKPRDDHKDAYENYQKEGAGKAEAELVSEKLPKSARVLPQPGDGSCLFHSLSHGLKKKGQGASALRAEIADYIATHPEEEVAGNPISDWILWDSGEDPKAYALSMREGSRWGGAMEIALCAKLHRVRVDIFERRSDHFLRIASFGEAEKFEPVRLLYGGRVHYDALEVCWGRPLSIPAAEGSGRNHDLSFASAVETSSKHSMSTPTVANRYFAMRIPTSRHQFQRDVPEDIQPISIAIVGRPNVGKSTLFNRLQSGTRRKKRDLDHRAIISDRAGTTRDRKDALALLYGLLLRVIDTGGLESPKETSANTLLQSMQEQVWRAIAEAQAILFLIDAQEGITPSDLAIAKMLRDGAGNADRYRDLFKTETPRDVPIILIANKAENTFIGPYLNDCYELGVGDPVIISAKQNQGMDDLYDRLLLEVGHLQQQEEENPGTAFMPTDEEGMYMQGLEGEGMAEEAEEEEAEGDLEDEEELSGQSDSESGPPPGPTLPWLTLDMPEQKWRSLRYYAHHPSDPLGALDPGLKAAVMHDDGRRIGKYWLGAKQRSLPTKEARDYVLRHRRAQEMENAMKVAIIGQPNGGKSSIINALLQEERCVVDEADGTTMDSIITNWTFKEHPVKLIDTCGIYRGWQYSGTTAEFVQPGMGTRKAIRRAHVCVLCLDAQRYAKMTHNSCPNKFEINLGNFVADEGKCLIIVRPREQVMPVLSPEAGDWGQEAALDSFQRVAGGEGVVAAVLVDPDGDAAERFGPAVACRAMTSMMTRTCQARGRSSRWRRRRGHAVRVARAPKLSERPELSTPSTATEPSTPVVTDFLDSQPGLAKEKLDLCNWMAALPDQLPLCKVSIPGTHDSATFQMWPLPVNWAYVHAYGQTQDWDISAQLAAGVRFLDLRVKADGWLYHGPLACALTLEAALQTCHSFLQEHRSELLLLRIKDEERSRESAHRVYELVKKFAKYMPLYFSQQSCLVCDLRGKMLVLQDWQGPEITLPWGNSTMKIQDFWNPGSLKEKWVAVLKHLRGAPRRQGEQLCANFLSAQSFPRRTPRYFAGILNTRFCASVSRRRYSALGIVVMDFPTQELINQIIRTNFIQAQVPATRVLQTLESCCRQYASTLRDIDRAAGAKPASSAVEEYVEKLSAVYARLLVQRSQFAIVPWLKHYMSLHITFVLQVNWPSFLHQELPSILFLPCDWPDCTSLYVFAASCRSVVWLEQELLACIALPKEPQTITRIKAKRASRSTRASPDCDMDVLHVVIT